MTRQRLVDQPRRPWAVWLALCVALVMALAPTLSHALAWMHQGASGGYTEICTASGPRRVALDGAVNPTNSPTDSPDGQESALQLLHCPFCLHATDRMAPWPKPSFPLFLVQDGQRETAVWQAFFCCTHTALAPPPRGPPLRA